MKENKLTNEATNPNFFPETVGRKDRTYYLLTTKIHPKAKYAIQSKSRWSDVGSTYYIYGKDLKYIGSAEVLQGGGWDNGIRINKYIMDNSNSIKELLKELGKIEESSKELTTKDELNTLYENAVINENNEETCPEYVTETDGIQYDLKFRKQALNDYLYTALWTEELETEYDITDIDPDSVEKAKSDIDSFIYKARKAAPEELSTYLNVGDDEPSLGGNIWLSRNGHGAGFFDQNNDKLQDLAREMGEVYMYVGDDNIVYIEG